MNTLQISKITILLLKKEIQVLQTIMVQQEFE